MADATSATGAGPIVPPPVEPPPIAPDPGGGVERSRAPSAPREWQRLMQAIGRQAPRDLRRARVARGKIRRIGRR